MNLLIFVIVLNEFSLIFYLEFGMGGGDFLLFVLMYLLYINMCRLFVFWGLFVLKWGLGRVFFLVEKRMFEKFCLKFMLILFYMIKIDLCW